MLGLHRGVRQRGAVVRVARAGAQPQGCISIWIPVSPCRPRCPQHPRPAHSLADLVLQTPPPLVCNTPDRRPRINTSYTPACTRHCIFPARWPLDCAHEALPLYVALPSCHEIYDASISSRRRASPNAAFRVQIRRTSIDSKCTWVIDTLDAEVIPTGGFQPVTSLLQQPEPRGDWPKFHLRMTEE